jgi:hypothetical protein
MDQLPARLRAAAGDEPVIESVDLGGGDALVVTPGATHIYRAEGLLSDERVESFSHDVDRFAVQESRRKHTLILEALDGEKQFTVPARAAGPVVEAVLEGVLRTIGVVDREESVQEKFRFSDLTLVVTDAKLFKHVGPSVWNENFEMFDYDSLTGLAFEEGRLATQVVLEVQGRQHRVKVPNDRAGQVRREIQSAVFAYHDVTSLEGLRAAVGDDADEDGDDAHEPVERVTEPRADDDADDDFSGTEWSPPADQDVTGPRGTATSGTDDESAEAADTATDEWSDPDDAGVDAFAAAAGSDAEGPELGRLAERVEALEATLERQTELLEDQTETIEQLVEELRRGR